MSNYLYLAKIHFLDDESRFRRTTEVGLSGVSARKMPDVILEFLPGDVEDEVDNMQVHKVEIFSTMDTNYPVIVYDADGNYQPQLNSLTVTVFTPNGPYFSADASEGWDSVIRNMLSFSQIVIDAADAGRQAFIQGILNDDQDEDEEDEDEENEYEDEDDD